MNLEDKIEAITGQRVKIAEMNNNPSIIVRRRANDYHACFEYRPTQWGCGSTIESAVADLARGWPEEFKEPVFAVRYALNVPISAASQ